MKRQDKSGESKTQKVRQEACQYQASQDTTRQDKATPDKTRQDPSMGKKGNNRTDQDTVGVYICAQVMDNDML